MSEFATDDCVVYYSRGSEFRSALFDELLPVRFNKAQLE
jgi:cytidine deaminase